jgi:flagellar hook-basal body complex protein FliE
MDGLTIRNTSAMINQGATSAEMNSVSRPAPAGNPDIGIDAGSLGSGSNIGSINSPNAANPLGTVGGADQTQKSFAATLKDAVGQVNTLQKESDHKMQELATGKSQNIHETMIAAEKADIALRLMVQVRNKMIEAYQEMMRMQV